MRFFFLFFSPLGLPFPQVPLQEPFLNTHANKRGNVSFRGWQNKEPGRGASSFAAGAGPPQQGCNRALIHFQQVQRALKEPTFPKTFSLVFPNVLYTAASCVLPLHSISLRLESSWVGKINIAETGRDIYQYTILCSCIIQLWLI